MILDGIIGLIVGAMILTRWPEDSAFIVGTVVGIRLLLSGILVLAVGTAFGNPQSDTDMSPAERSFAPNM
jgi:uncharacterized membrane protein HdeD (DUF308 family)